MTLTPCTLLSDDRGDFVGSYITGITGTGTQSDPYLVTSLDDLFAVSIHADNLPANYLRLTTDINYDATRGTSNYHPNFDYNNQRRLFYFDMYGHRIYNITLDDKHKGLFSSEYCRLYIQNGQLANIRCTATGAAESSWALIGHRGYYAQDNHLEFDNMSIQCDASITDYNLFYGCMFNRCSLNIRRRQPMVKPLIITASARPKNHVANVFYQCDFKFDIADTRGYPVIDAVSLGWATQDLIMTNCRFSGNINSTVSKTGATDAVLAHMLSSDRCVYNIDVRYDRVENLYYSNFADHTVENLANYDLTRSCVGSNLTKVNSTTITNYNMLNNVWAYLR